VISVGLAVLLAVLVEQLQAVVRPDSIAQVIKQFDDGEARRPIGTSCPLALASQIMQPNSFRKIR
jgi:hypothetical protein